MMQKVADLELESSQTFENLKKAFYDEASLAFRYRFFSVVADFEGMDQYSALFKEFAEGGVQTVHGCLDFLRIVGDPSAEVPIGSTQKNVEAVLQTEIRHFSEQYREMARVAREEGFTDVASWFDTLEKLKRSRVSKIKRASHE